MIQSSNANLYFSGDSGYGPHFAEIGQKYGPFDLAFIENGQYNVVSRQIHVYPEDGIQAFKDLNARVLMPIHWGVYALSRHPWYEPAERIATLAQENGIALYTPKIGELLSLSTPTDSDQWWVPLMQRQQAQQ